MTITLDKAYLEDVSNGLYTVGDASTNTVTVERFARLVNSTESRLKSDGLIQDGALVSGAEWGAAYLVADILHRTKLMGRSDLIKESWGGDYSYEFRAKTVTEMSVDYFMEKYLEVVNSLNSDEFGITDAITDGAEREDSEIEFTQLDQNGPALIKPSTSELIKRWS
jgi:hypothetical protein